MRRTLGYADAVRLLGGKDSEVLDALSALTGGAMLAAAVPFPALLAWLDAKTEFVRLSHRLLRELSERRSGLSRFGRTERLEAAHAVIVVTAYFEALGEARLPFRFTDLELTAAEQVSIAGGGPQVGGGPQSAAGAFLPHTVFSVHALLPGPQHPYERLLKALRGYYREVSDAVRLFVAGLAVWDRLPGGDRKAFELALDEVPDRAGARYEELLRRLATDFPEVAFWSGQREHQATRAQVERVGIALAGIGDLLARISTGQLPDERRAALARANAAVLRRPVVRTVDVPAGLRAPALAEGYVTPLFRVANAGPGARPSDEAWWEGVPVRDDLDEFLIGHLTRPQAVQAPLLVLGQPGSGKSVLTTMLAARLPAADFLAVRVPLRDVPVAAALQDQIEYAIRSATGERLDWPALARSAKQALPVVLLDGFDELLQATGVSQSDYLIRVADFQRREADQGRPVVVVVTSRISVADRAAAPEGTLAVRLEPFDEPRIAAWLSAWNAANADYFTARDLTPLALDAVLPHRELAGQPLLLLMLALYDADRNALRRTKMGLRRDELYERLLLSFARREVDKHRPGLPDRDLHRMAEDELRRLSLVAFAMFSRNAQWVTETDLAADLRAVLGEPGNAGADTTSAAASGAGQDLRAPLGPAEIVLGRFFFVHRAQALRDGARLETYEFLHATFGEYLVARLTWLVLRDMAAREAAATLSLTAAAPDDDLLHALLSYSALGSRTAVIGFLADLMSATGAPERAAIADLVLRLFRTVHQPRPPRKLAGYGPAGRPVPLRHAAYSANLVMLAVVAAGRVLASELFGRRQGDPAIAWKREALLWRSQLGGEGWTSLVRSLAVRREYGDGGRDVLLYLDDGTFQPPPVDLHWTFEMGPDDPRRAAPVIPPLPADMDFLRRRTHFLCRRSDDLSVHVLDGVTALGAALATPIGLEPGSKVTAGRALLDLLLRAPGSAASERERWYERCARLAADDSTPWPDDTRKRYAALLLNSLATDDGTQPATAARILSLLESSIVVYSSRVAASLIRCGLHYLNRDPNSDPSLIDAMVQTLGLLEPVGDHLRAEAYIRITESANAGVTKPSSARLVLGRDWLDEAELLADRAGRQDLLARVRRLRRRDQ